VLKELVILDNEKHQQDLNKIKNEKSDMVHSK
jgi:hypothetical protein